ncbi:MAG: hypothetical protein OEX19_13245, partial [Gammaproteobacteria bacterium]|nr:hypothetical protein [Gammaproteobacteria bacterium]
MKLSPRNAPLLLAIPLVMLGIITLIAPYAKQLPDTIQMQLGVFPYLAILGTGVMGFVFRRYRFIYLAIIMGVAYWNLQLLYSEPPENLALYEALFGL